MLGGIATRRNTPDIQSFRSTFTQEPFPRHSLCSYLSQSFARLCRSFTISLALFLANIKFWFSKEVTLAAIPAYRSFRLGRRNLRLRRPPPLVGAKPPP